MFRKILGVSLSIFCVLACIGCDDSKDDSKNDSSDGLSNVKQEWMVRYQDAYNGDHEPVDMEADTDGNVYVTGSGPGASSYLDCILVKYDTNGNQLWDTRFIAPGQRSKNWPRDLTLDSEGNIYVTVYSSYFTDVFDCFTIKYDTDGNQVWAAKFEDPDTIIASAEALAVDNSGNVYVTGSRKQADGERLPMLVKFDSNGNQVWSKNYARTGHVFAGGLDVEVDNAGYVYVAGYGLDMSASEPRDSEYCTIKHDPDGNILWQTLYDRTSGGSDSIKDMAVDNNGNVFVTGNCDETFGVWHGKWDFISIKYDQNGSQLWMDTYNARYVMDLVSAMAVDKSGNLYVTGRTEGYIATIKYDQNGKRVWVANTENGPGNDIIVDDDGKAYVTGGSTVFMTVKYNSDGKVVWKDVFDEPLAHDEKAIAISMDSNRNIYVTGDSPKGSSWSRFCTIKYSQW